MADAAGKKPEKAPVKKKKKKTRIGLGFKFSFFVGLLITAILTTVTVFIYNQIKTALTYEVTQRGTAIAVNMANNAFQPLLDKDSLLLSGLAAEAVQSPYKEEELGKDFVTEIQEILTKEIFNISGKTAPKNEGIMEAFIVNKEGIIVSTNKNEFRDQLYSPPPGVRPLADTDDVLIQEFTRNGRNYFDIGVSIRKRLGTQWLALGQGHLTVSQSIIARTVLIASVRLVLITLMSLIAGIIASLVLVNVLTNPIKFLMQGVRAIGEGNYDVAIKVKTRDELGELSDAFNSTAKSLKEKELLKGAFSTYVSSTVMEQILKDPGKLSLHGTRVRCTMLFTDIRGFTSMSETMEPEQVVAIINEYLTLQTDKVFKWEGLLDKFVGDCVMAVYGLPFPKADDSYRAVRTAMDMRDGIEKLNVIRKRRDQMTVGVGIGVNTGDVVAGNMGSPQKMDYTVIGDNVNLAARLEANAPAGNIFVSESTYNETKDRIEYEQREPISVKGKKEPVKIYSPIRVKGEAAPQA